MVNGKTAPIFLAFKRASETVTGKDVSTSEAAMRRLFYMIEGCYWVENPFVHVELVTMDKTSYGICTKSKDEFGNIINDGKVKADKMKDFKSEGYTDFRRINLTNEDYSRCVGFLESTVGKDEFDYNSFMKFAPLGSYFYSKNKSPDGYNTWFCSELIATALMKCVDKQYLFGVEPGDVTPQILYDLMYDVSFKADIIDVVGNHIESDVFR